MTSSCFKFLGLVLMATSITGCVDPVGLVFNTDEVLAYHFGTNQPSPTVAANVSAKDTGSGTASNQTPNTSNYYDSLNCDELRNTITVYESPTYRSQPSMVAAAGYAKLAFTQKGCVTDSSSTPAAPVIEKAKGYLGARLLPIESTTLKSLKIDSEHGVLVVQVIEGSPAFKAGIQVDDIITTFNGQSVTTPEALTTSIQNTRIGFSSTLEIWRKSKVKEITAVIARAPSTTTMSPASNSNLSNNATTETSTIIKPASDPLHSYCFAMVTRSQTGTGPTESSGFLTPAWQDIPLSNTLAKNTLNQFHNYLRVQPDKFLEPSDPVCTDKLYTCTAVVQDMQWLTLYSQAASVLCYATREEAALGISTIAKSYPYFQTKTWQPTR
jgi:hypothetical protein